MGDLHGDEQQRAPGAYRARQKKGRHVISVEVDDADLREIAIAGYPEAVSTDRAAQGKAISLFLSDSINW
jgi:hypothetical protein